MPKIDAPRRTRSARPIRLGIIGTGGMANEHARRFKEIPDCQIVAACDIDPARVAQFAADHGIPQTFTDLDSFLTQGQFEAVANVTPDRFHAPISIACLKAGKHVLCEKPLATTYAEAAEMARTAVDAGTIHMVNFTYRNSPALQEAARLVARGALGSIKHVEGSYFQDWLATDHWGCWKTSPGWLWRLSTAHGSKGVLGDIGVHLIDFASFPVGPLASVHCLLTTFPKAPNNQIDDYHLDANDTALMTATFEGGAVGVLQVTRWATGHRNRLALSIFGEEGALKIDLERSDATFEFCRVNKRMADPWRTVATKPTPSIFQRFITSIRTHHNDQPDFVRGAAIQKVLDACEISHREGRSVTLSTFPLTDPTTPLHETR